MAKHDPARSSVQRGLTQVGLTQLGLTPVSGADSSSRADLAGLELSDSGDALQDRRACRRTVRGRSTAGSTSAGSPTSICMTDLGRDLRGRLAADFDIRTPRLVGARDNRSTGRRSFCSSCADRRRIESVFIPDTPAMTFCISSQVGCAMDCAFCLTGQDGVRPQSHRGRDRRPGARARRVARPPRHALQHRPHGDGRAAAQLRRRDAVDPHARRASRARHAPEADHALDRRARAGNRAADARADRAEPRDLAARDDRRATERDRADQPQVSRSLPCSTRAVASRSRSATASPSST